jgi:hypothetical protein
MQSEIDQHKPLVILPDSYLCDLASDFLKWKMYFILAISILAFITSLLVYETPYPVFGYTDMDGESQTSLLGLSKGLVPLYLFYVFYTLGRASIVSYSKKRWDFWMVACLCLVSHNIGWLVLLNSRPGWTGIIIWIILSFIAISFFLFGCTFHKKLTWHGKISFTECEKKFKIPLM